MKARTLSLMATAGFGGAMLLGQAAPASYVGLQVEAKPNQFGLSVCNVYAIFDNPNDVMVAVAGTTLTPMNITVTGGTFYQSLFGNDQAPSPALIDLFPSLAFDTFVTIGKKTSIGDQTILTAGWPGFGPSQLSGDSLAWFVTPGTPQAIPVDQGDGTGHVLIGQFSTTADLTVPGNSIAGTFLIQAISDGDQGFLAEASFFHGVPAPGALALLGLAGMVGRRRRR